MTEGLLRLLLGCEEPPHSPILHTSPSMKVGQASHCIPNTCSSGEINRLYFQLNRACLCSQFPRRGAPHLAGAGCTNSDGRGNRRCEPRVFDAKTWPLSTLLNRNSETEFGVKEKKIALLLCQAKGAIAG